MKRLHKMVLSVQNIAFYRAKGRVSVGWPINSEFLLVSEKAWISNLHFWITIFSKILFKGAFKETFGPMKEDWKFKNSFFGDEYNLIISVELFLTGIGYESYFKTFNLKSIKALSFTAPIELCYSHHWHRNWCIKK